MKTTNKNTIKILLITLFVSFSTFIYSQSSASFSDFYNSHKGEKGITTMSFGGSMISVFLKEEDKEAKALMEKTDNISFFVLEKHNEQIIEEFNQIIQNEIYKTLMVIREGASQVHFKIRENKDFIEEIFMIADEGDSYAIMCWSGKFSMEDAKQFTKSVHTEKSFHIGN